MRVNRNIAVLKRVEKEEDDHYVPGSAEERMSMMWELTAELWSLRGSEDEEGRLRRDVVKLIRRVSVQSGKNLLSPEGPHTASRCSATLSSMLERVIELSEIGARKATRNEREFYETNAKRSGHAS